ncbi:MAG: SDR family NAD(P)-dependent oxidoreductase, partial [Candidatus Rokuibacteriota bacterium]
MDNRTLSGKVAWVTGSSRGLGRVMASHLGRLGATVVVHGTTLTSARAFGEAESLDQVARDVAAETGGRVLAVWGDLTDPGQVQAAVAKIRAELGRIDMLVN